MESRVTGVVVVEGPDCSGKSTLCKELKTRYGAIVIPMRRKFLNQMFDYNTAVLLKAWDLSKDNLVVLDRSWLSEEIYAPIFRPNYKYTEIGTYCEMILNRLGAIYVFCDPYDGDVDSQVQAHARAKDPDHPYEDSRYRCIVEQYHAAAYNDASRLQTTDINTLNRHFLQWINVVRSPYDSLIYDYHKPEPFFHNLESGLSYQKTCLSELKIDDHNLTGNPSMATFLFIGDSANPKYKRQRVLWPFHEYGNCSLFLHQCLIDAHYEPSQMCFMNAIVQGRSQEAQLAHLLDRFPHLVPVALGEIAETLIKSVENDGPSYRTAHPQYVKRFKGPEGRLDYTKDLKQIYSFAT